MKSDPSQHPSYAYGEINGKLWPNALELAPVSYHGVSSKRYISNIIQIGIV